MSEKEEEQHVVKVKDRRRFNIDGSIREGFEKEPEPIREVPKAVEPMKSASPEPEPPESAEIPDGEEIPGADDPASFVNFLSTLATNAAAALGAMPHPATGQRQLDLDSAKYWLDVLGMLREKTNGNLHPQEARLLDGLLADLRMQYVKLVRATEERLKQQAAKKFSANDILGKK
jgi:hypothetical protein